MARQDIVDAIDWTIKRYSIDAKNILLVGGSGGGHMALMMGAYAPRYWRGISAWCPITDLAEWCVQRKSYAPAREACCGGPPGATAVIDGEYRSRSPIFIAEHLAAVNLSVHHGRLDRTVPYTHTLKLVLEMEKFGAQKLFFEIFDGGHNRLYDVAFRWFDRLVGLDTEQAKQLSR